jgi:glutamine amidotransferase
VKRFRPTLHEDKVPCMGWNKLSDVKDPLLQEDSYVYFVHSYYVPLCEHTIATANYVLPYSAALHKDNFYTTQFHPEKSGQVGERILKKFLEL